MFFTRVGMVIAHLIFWLGAVRVGMGFFIAFFADDMNSKRRAAEHYLAASTTAEAINHGMIWILIALAIGVLCEISARKDRAGPKPDAGN